MKYLLKIRTSENRTSGDRTSGGPLYIYLGLGWDFGLQKIRDLDIMCPYSVPIIEMDVGVAFFFRCLDI